MNRHNARKLICLGLVFAITQTAFGQGVDILSRIQERGQLNCGIDSTGNKLNESFQIKPYWSGFDIDFYAAIAAATGVRYQFEAIAPAQIPPSVATAERHIVLSYRNFKDSNAALSFGVPVLIQGKQSRVPVVATGKWSEQVSAVIRALVEAERYNLTSSNVDKFQRNHPEKKRFFDKVDLVGAKAKLPKGWAVRAIKAAGNYGEIYQRKFGKQATRGANKSQLDGGKLVGLWDTTDPTDVHSLLIGKWKFDQKESTKAFESAAKTLGGLPRETIAEINGLFKSLESQEPETLTKDSFKVTKSKEGKLILKDDEGTYGIEIVNNDVFKIDLDDLFFPLVMKRVTTKSR